VIRLTCCCHFRAGRPRSVSRLDIFPIVCDLAAPFDVRSPGYPGLILGLLGYRREISYRPRTLSPDRTALRGAGVANHGTVREIVRTVGSIGRALLADQDATQELHDLAVELSWLEAELVAGRLPAVRLESVLRIIAELEYTPWRMPSVVEDLYKIWTLLGML
jgi:hypothetical protein